MIKNYLKIAFRNMAKNKVLSFINIFGLAVGIACSLVIILYIQDELSFDRFNKDPERIYRVVKDFVNDDGSKLPDATTPPALAPAMQAEIPEIEQTVRIFSNWGGKYLVKYGDKKFYEEGLYRADSSIFNVFNFPFVRGNANDAFKQLKAIVFTETAAKKYFGNEDPLGKTIEIERMGPHTVSGVIKDVPANSHFTFDFLISTRTIGGGGNIDQIWGFYNFYTYIKLKPNTSIASVEPKIKALFKKNQPDNSNIFYTQPLTDIHLKSNLKWELKPNSDTTYVYVFATIALFIIIIGSINYVNLVTAKSSLRAREIGVRKVIGAERWSLIRQFLIESIVTVFLASLLALALAQLILPAFNNITQKELTIFSGNHQLVLMLVIGFTLFIGLLAGLYPAFYLSGFRPVFVLKGINTSGKNTITLRKSLVVLQFVISVVLIVGSLVINSQMKYMQSAKLGFNKEHVVVLNNVERSNLSEAFKDELKKIPGVKKLSGADGMIGGQNWTNNFRMKGSENGQLINFLSVGYDFIDVMGITLKEGRGFSVQYPADSMNNGTGTSLEQVRGSVIINEKAVKDLSVPAPSVGQLLVYSTDADTTYYVKVVGVVNDFHFTSLRNEIKPFAFLMNNRRISSLAINVDSKDMNETLAQMQSKWQSMFPDKPFDYYFLDESINKLYKADQNFKSLFSYFTIIALIIACLGLFGLAAFTAEQRTKEIGIRKVLGATVSNIVAMLSKDFLKLVIVASFIAFPIAWYMMHKWLEDFSYRINISWWVFVIGSASACVIALLTVSFQAIKAAISNPVKSLRTE